MKYSISIVFHKWFDRLERLIRSIHRYPPEDEYEILLSGDNLTPGELAKLWSLKGKEHWLLTYLEDRIPTSIAINLNLCRARGDFILHCDDDIEFLHPHWAERLVAVLRQPIVTASAVTAGVASGRQKVPSDHNPDEHTGEIWSLPGTWWGGFCFMSKRELFDFAHPNFVGFYDCFAMAQGDDKDWLRRVMLYGHKAVICPGAMVMHHGCQAELVQGHIPAAANYKWSQPNYLRKWKYFTGNSANG